MRNRVRRTLAAAAALTTVAAAAAPASVIEKGRIVDETYGFGYDCGFPVEVTGVASGNYRLRDDGHGTFFSLERATFHEVHTNTVTGEWFVVRGHWANNETNAVHVSGSLYEFDVVKAGQMAVI